jgi:8-oxo-dGTP diphosphatase
VTDWHAVPVFGERVAGARYTLRPGAYAVIGNELGQVAVVRTSVGTFLPGGGIEPGETPEEAVVREAKEECALLIRQGPWLTHALQFVYSLKEKQYFEKQSTFFEATVESALSTVVEDDHEMVWLSPADACRELSHESHGWAVERWLQSRT